MLNPPPQQVVHAVPGEIPAPSGFTPKDFCLIKVDSLYHAFYIMTDTGEVVYENKFGHSVSCNLVDWTFVDETFTAAESDSALGQDRIWAPTVIYANGQYYMFYTSVAESVGVYWQRLACVTTSAISKDSAQTTWSKPTEVLPCDSLTSCTGSSWANCSTGALRDPFIMPSPYESGSNSGWLAYYVAIKSGHTDKTLVGSARASSSVPNSWADRGPIMSTWYPNQDPSLDRSYNDESPHLIKYGDTWYMFLTESNSRNPNGSIRYLTGSDPLGDTCSLDDPVSWTWKGSAWPTIDKWDFASETFSEGYAGGSRDDYFCVVHDDTTPNVRRIQIREMRWQPTETPPFRLVDPIYVTALGLGSAGPFTEGDTIQFQMTVANTDTVLHTAHLEVYEVDGTTHTAISPTSIGLPDPVTGLSGSGTVTIPFKSKLFADDDSTHSKLEIVIRYRGAVTSQFIIQDTLRPAAATDVTAHMGKTTAAIEWTATGDDSVTGMASLTRLAYSTETITEDNFFECETLPTASPDTAGTTECAEASYGTLSSCTWYYFALKTQDNAGNWSGLSNVVRAKTKCTGSTEVMCAEGFSAQGGGPDSWSLENSVLDLAAVGTSATDLYALKAPPEPGADRTAVRLSQKGGGELALDAARLAVVDHPAGVEAFPCDGQVLLGQASPVHAITDDTGANLAPVLDADEYARVGMAGSAWEVVLAEEAAPGRALLVEVTGGGPVGDEQASGVDVQVPTSGGGWWTVSRIYPRRGFDPFVVDSLEANQVRLLFRAEYSVRRLARVEPSQVVVLSPIEPDRAVHSRLGTVTDAVAAPGGTSTGLKNREAVVLGYPLPALAKDLERDLFLLLRGERSTAGAPQATARRAPEEDLRPTAFALRQNQPNPFKTSTTIRFDLPVASSVVVEVYDAQGRKVRTLASGTFSPGYHAVEWDERDEGGNFVRPGVYLYRIEAGSVRDQKKMVRLP